jgi:hypothetical protein
VLPYIYPSRHYQSDRLHRLAVKEFLNNHPKQQTRAPRPNAPAPCERQKGHDNPNGQQKSSH